MIVLILSVGVISLWQKYKGLWYANKPSNTDITTIIPSVQSPKGKQNLTSLPLTLPEGYSLSIYAQNLGNLRDLILDPKGVILASITNQGKVVAIVNGKAETVVSDLNQPHGLAFSGNKLYIAETDKVAIYDYDTATHIASNKRKIIDLPKGGGHFTRSLLIKEGKLYVAIGSSCNVCVESDARRAAIWVANLDGSNFRSFAQGLRNSVFLALDPNTNDIWATNMGRDNLGNDLPPDTINIIKEGANYGWPYCYGNKVIDSQMNPGGSKFDCSKMEAPHLAFQAHSAPLGLAFLGNDLLVSFHGSWNRSIPTGYKVVRFHLDKKGNLLEGPSDFISGWLESNGNVLGRPVDILIKGSEIYISDDKAGVIYLLQPI